jgi:hypothetical protein
MLTALPIVTSTFKVHRDSRNKKSQFLKVKRIISATQHKRIHRQNHKSGVIVIYYPYIPLSHIYKGNGEEYGNPTYKAPLNGTLRSFCSCRFVDPRSSYRKTVTKFSFRRVYSVTLHSNKHEKSNSQSLRRCEGQKTLQYIFECWITHNRTQN